MGDRLSRRREALLLALGCVILAANASLALAGATEAILRGAVEREGAYELAAGPNVEGVVFLRQVYPREESWPEPVIEAFHRVDWIDAASVRVRWADLEPSDQQFNWRAFDRILAEVRKHNEWHPESPRTLHIRPMGGEHVPAWFEESGVKMYDTLDPHRRRGTLTYRPIRIPVPYDNPRFLEQLRQVYIAMRNRYGDDPLVTVYHGTWSAGPWDEIFHPQDNAPLPPGYTKERFVQGMIEQLDVLIDEVCLHGKVAELPYSGKYPPKSQIDITGPLTARIVERLGRRSPFFYIQSNGWGVTGDGTPTVSWGHERDVKDAFGRVNLAFQAIGTNAGGGWHVQGNWIDSVALAKQYQAAYLEVYYADFMPLDEEHHITAAFTHDGSATGATPGFLGFRPWLKARDRRLYVREGTLWQRFSAGAEPRRVASLRVSAEVPEATQIGCRVRTRKAGSPWSEWQEAASLGQLPPGHEAEVEAVLHTDDGCVTPRLLEVQPVWIRLPDVGS
ncbi:MAG: hypothetical protein GXX96_26075 [Planctomycetaceae bacterium]|nr:hypothetical protein [Planctomycetaceae bacterium]